MEELKNEINSAIQSGETGNLHETAKKWANYCLDTYTGEVLEKGLKVSIALANFHLELFGVK